LTLGDGSTDSCDPAVCPGSFRGRHSGDRFEDKPSAPLLGVNGKLDDQAPVEDIYLLMEHGTPKEARIYPEGRHMGRTPGMPGDEIARMIAAWLKDKLARPTM
jgi:hypothetical protein